MHKSDEKWTMKQTVSKQKREFILKRARLLANRLSSFQMLAGRIAHVTEAEIVDLCALLPEVFMEEKSCLYLTLDSPLLIIGDIHGHYVRLLQVLNVLGHPPANRYLFLGNYVNRGPQSLETILLLFSYKLLYPKNIYLLRGNHESEQVGRLYGFYEECKRRFSSHMWSILMETFNYLPVAAVVENLFFCTHSGISPTVMYSKCSGPKALQEYISLWTPRPTEIESNILASQLTWSEPDSLVKTWEPNPAGLGYLFGPKQVAQFCEQFSLAHVIRSNCLVPEGFEFFADEKLLTIFSAPNFLNKYGNWGAVLQLNRSPHRSGGIVCSVKHLRPIQSKRGKLMGQTVVVVEDARCTNPL